MHKSDVAKDFLLDKPDNRFGQWAVDWLNKKMNEYFWSSTVTSQSNEDSNRKSFQRTQSAQVGDISGQFEILQGVSLRNHGAPYFPIVFPR